MSLRLIVFLFTLLHALAGLTQVYVGGELTEDATYSMVNNPYIVTQDLIVNQGVTLTIEPGVEIQFEFDTRLVSNGIFVARGTAANTIKFFPRNTLPFSGQWNGIVINGAKTSMDEYGNYLGGSVLSNAILSKASYSLTLGGGTALLVDSVQFSTCSFGVNFLSTGYNTIRNCLFSNSDYGIYFASGEYNGYNLIEGNIFENNSEIGIFINNKGEDSEFCTVAGNRFNGCKIGMHAGNFQYSGESHNRIIDNIFYKNQMAAKLFLDSMTVRNNYFIGNNSGIICWNSENNIMDQNLFDGNQQYAIMLTAGSGYNYIAHNNICNGVEGVLVLADSSLNSLYNSFLYNSIHANSTHSMFLEGGTQGPVQFNNLCYNAEYQSFKNQNTEIVQAGYNYWAKTDTSGIDSLILDRRDNDLLGEVLYTPYLTEPTVLAPIMAPLEVRKQQIGNHLIISWDTVNFSTLDHYELHYGKTDCITFEKNIDNGLKTLYIFEKFNASDTIAITAVDIVADGMKDQTEGHKSEYAYAKSFPYAGPDTAVCYNASINILNATAYDYEMLNWTTSGDGTFSNQHTLNPEYTPGFNDISKGEVTLRFEVIFNGYEASDDFLLRILSPPVVFAGSDTAITSDSSFHAKDASASGYRYLKWTSSGDGIFDNDSIIDPVYTPGQTDKTNAKVRLVLSAFSVCGEYNDTLNLEIVKGYEIHGRIHAGDLAAANTTISIYQKTNTGIKRLRGDQVAANSDFTIYSLKQGEYFLYFIPDEQFSNQFVPTYFFNEPRWQQANSIVVDANVYDVDIQLYRKTLILPTGEGTISGYCTSEGGGGSCGDVSVLLYDAARKNILDWIHVEKEGDFRFRYLPFGQYILAGEKAGIPSIESKVIDLNPLNPSVEEINLVCLGEKYEFLVPGKSASVFSEPVIFPNPFIKHLNINNLPENSTIRLIRSSGMCVYVKNAESNNIQLNLEYLPAGLYVLEINMNDGNFYRAKLVKQP